MNKKPEHLNPAVLPTPHRPPDAPTSLERVLADACERALAPDMPFNLLLEFGRSIASLAREVRNLQSDMGWPQHLPLGLTEQIEAVRDLLVRHAHNPVQPEVIADRLRKLTIRLTKTADLARPPQPKVFVLTHPASISQWVH